MRIGILGTFDSPYVADLQRAARQYFPCVETVCLRFGDLQVGTGNANVRAVGPLYRMAPAATPAGLPAQSIQANSPEVDAIIVRSMPIGSLEQVVFRMDCLQTWQSRGVKVVNPPRSLEVAIDKWLCLQRLSEADIEVPPTICCQTRAAAMAAFDELGGDVLVKPLFGGEGRGIIRVANNDMAWRVFGTLQQLGQVLYVQQFIEHFGYDIRVLFVGDRHFAIRRVAADGEWRTNISQGSVAEPHQLHPKQQELACRSRDAIGGCILGIDLLPARDGRLFVLEVNGVPGWKGLAAALNVDIAQQLLNTVIAGCG